LADCSQPAARSQSVLPTSCAQLQTPSPFFSGTTHTHGAQVAEHRGLIGVVCCASERSDAPATRPS
jgi:hypothetical protein